MIITAADEPGYERTWHLENAERKEISKWRGKTFLGFDLMEVREQIRAERGEDSGSISI